MSALGAISSALRCTCRAGLIKAQRSKRGAEFFQENLRLFPCREVSAAVDRLGVDQIYHRPERERND